MLALNFVYVVGYGRAAKIGKSTTPSLLSVELFALHSFQTSTPCRRRSRCSGSAIGFARINERTRTTPVAALPTGRPMRPCNRPTLTGMETHLAHTFGE